MLQFDHIPEEGPKPNFTKKFPISGFRAAPPEIKTLTFPPKIFFYFFLRTRKLKSLAIK